MIFLFVAFCLLCVDERHFSDEWRQRLDAGGVAQCSLGRERWVGNVLDSLTELIL
jgi:hypothetical protein